jgi:hypothetical protein
MGTAVATEAGAVSLICETAVEGTNFTIPPETGHLTVTKVGTLHPQAPRRLSRPSRRTAQRRSAVTVSSSGTFAP